MGNIQMLKHFGKTVKETRTILRTENQLNKQKTTSFEGGFFFVAGKTEISNVFLEDLKAISNLST